MLLRLLRLSCGSLDRCAHARVPTVSLECLAASILLTARARCPCAAAKSKGVEALTKLMLGGLPTGRIGGLLHCHLRYFDPARHRAGIPEDVAALVAHMDAESVSVVLGERDR